MVKPQCMKFVCVSATGKTRMAFFYKRTHTFGGILAVGESLLGGFKRIHCSLRAFFYALHDRLAGGNNRQGRLRGYQSGDAKCFLQFLTRRYDFLYEIQSQGLR